MLILWWSQFWNGFLETWHKPSLWHNTDSTTIPLRQPREYDRFRPFYIWGRFPFPTTKSDFRRLLCVVCFVTPQATTCWALPLDHKVHSIHNSQELGETPWSLCVPAPPNSARRPRTSSPFDSTNAHHCSHCPLPTHHHHSTHPFSTSKKKLKEPFSS